MIATCFNYKIIVILFIRIHVINNQTQSALAYCLVSLPTIFRVSSLQTISSEKDLTGLLPYSLIIDMLFC